MGHQEHKNSCTARGVRANVMDVQLSEKRGESGMKRISAERGGCWFLMSLMVVALLSFGCGAEEVKRISKEELKGMIGSPGLRIIDVRQPDQWKIATQKIQGAVREEPDQISTWMGKYSKERTLVFYCT